MDDEEIKGKIRESIGRSALSTMDLFDNEDFVEANRIFRAMAQSFTGLLLAAGYQPSIVLGIVIQSAGGAAFDRLTDGPD